MATLYHNPRCSKSRETLALLRERGIEPDIVRYLDDPPNRETLRGLTAMLGCSMRDLLRPNEDAYRTLGLADTRLSEEALYEAVAAHPQLLQRPIVVRGGRAAVGRPPAAVLEIL